MGIAREVFVHEEQYQDFEQYLASAIRDYKVRNESCPTSCNNAATDAAKELSTWRQRDVAGVKETFDLQPSNQKHLTIMNKRVGRANTLTRKKLMRGQNTNQFDILAYISAFP